MALWIYNPETIKVPQKWHVAFQTRFKIIPVWGWHAVYLRALIHRRITVDNDITICHQVIFHALYVFFHFARQSKGSVF